jgi:hypothetical protein
MRIWVDPFTEEHEAAMNEVIKEYREMLKAEFKNIFNDIEQVVKK